MTEPLPKPRLPGARRTRVFVVDDSVVVRGLLARWLAEEPDLEAAGSAADGVQAIRKLVQANADICVLDLEMPVMGGLEALPHLLSLQPKLKILIASRLTKRGAEITLRALELGAADYVAKPEASGLGGADAFRRELFEKARALAGDPGGEPTPDATPSAPTLEPISSQVRRALPAQLHRPEILVVGASTGGPQALRLFLQNMGASWPTPIVMVQHMPATFTDLLASHLAKGTSLSVVTAVDGMPMLAGRAYLAPGDFHLRFERQGETIVARLDQGPSENYCRPSVDVLFRSAAETFREAALAVVLTGMGRDGLAGSAAIARAGGVILAQDEESSVVWGMPGAVAKAGWASVVGDLEHLALAARALSRCERP